VQRIKDHLGSLVGARIAVWGIAFKQQTDDTRYSPAIALMNLLAEEGAQITAYDPKALPDKTFPKGLTIAASPYSASNGCDAVVIATDWAEFRSVNLRELRMAMRGNLLVDGRNVLNQQQATDAGFVYLGIGRGARGEKAVAVIQARTSLRAA
jgi:UDPglucose 6-dehydrogenase